MKLWLLWLALSCAALAQTSNAPATKKTADDTASAQYGAITGRVIGTDGPVPFANVSVAAASGPGRAGGGGGKSVTTDAEGNFKIDGLQALAWRVTANAPGYVSDDADAATPEIAANQTYHRIGEMVTLRLVKGGVITGRVLNPAGEPLVAVRVNAQTVRDANGQAIGSGGNNVGGGPGGDFQTDDRGVYRIFGLPAGTYVVAAGAAGGFGPGNRLSPYDGNAPVYYPASTRDAAVEVVVNSGAETSGIDLQYRGEKGYAVSGKVTGATEDSGGRGGFTSVVLSHAATSSVVNRAFVTQRGGGRGRGQIQQSESSFALYGVPVGEYEVTAYRNSPAGEDAASAPRRFVVNGRDVTGVELALKPLASVAGRLQLESASQCKSLRRATFEEQVFRLRAEEPSKPMPGRPAGPIAAPNRTGELSFRQLNAGRYRLLTELLSEEWFVRSITLPGVAASTGARTAARTAAKPAAPVLLDAGRNGLALRAGERATGLVVMVAGGAAALAGRVKAATGVSLPAQTSIYLIPAEREQADDVLRYAETKTSSDGGFSLKNLAPGKYWVFARPAEKLADSVLVLKAWNATERAKLRREAEAANNVLELQPCQRLTNYELMVK